MNFNFRKFFGIIIVSFASIFLLAACVFTVTEYVPVPPTPSEPNQQSEIRVFNHYIPFVMPQGGDHPFRWPQTSTSNINFNSSVVDLTGTIASSPSGHVSILLVPVAFHNAVSNTFNNLNQLRTPNTSYIYERAK